MIGIRKHIFVCSYGRSGSTLLKNIISTIPFSHICGENGNSLYFLFKSISCLVRYQGEIGRNLSRFDGPWAGLHEVDVQLFKDRLIGAFMDEVLRPRLDTRVLGFKEIRFFEVLNDFVPFLDFLLDSFSNAKIVFVVRNHDDVCRSGWWRSVAREEVFRRLAVYDKLMGEYVRGRPNRAFMCRYESLFDGGDEIVRLFEFLGEQADMDSIGRVINCNFWKDNNIV